MTYKNKMKKLIFYLSTILPLIYIVNNFVSNSGSKFNSANFVLAIISIPFCLLYYRMNRQSNLFMYILIYISIMIENTSYWILSSRFNAAYYIHLDSFVLFRLFLLLLLIYPNSEISLLVERNKKKSVILTILLAPLLLISNGLINRDLHLPNLIVMDLLTIITFFIVILIILLLMRKAVKNKNFIETTASLSLAALYLRINAIFKYPFENKLSYDTANNYFFIAFFIILIGLYIEINYILLENTKLNKDVENISNNIKEIKEIEILRAQFFANLSHELKTPINIIFFNLSVIKLKKRKITSRLLRKL